MKLLPPARAAMLARVLSAPLLVALLYWLRANAWFRLYPAAMVAIALSVFAFSLRRTPVAERIARSMGERLDARGVDYCRRVTQVWTAFLAVNLAVTVATVFASPEVWAIWNGCVVYVLMGLLLAGERLVRRRVRHG